VYIGLLHVGASDLHEDIRFLGKAPTPTLLEHLSYFLDVPALKLEPKFASGDDFPHTNSAFTRPTQISIF